jgi:hypothetical protein
MLFCGVCVVCVCVRAHVRVCMSGFCNVCVCEGLVYVAVFGNMHTVLWLRVFLT